MKFRFVFRLLLALFACPLWAQSAWTVVRTDLPGVNYAQHVAFGNGRFVATLSGPRGTGGAAWSTDGLTWRATATTLPVQGTVVFTARAFFLAASGGVWRSADGDSWQQIYSPPAGALASYRGLATNGHGLLVGSANIFAKSLLYSPDFVNFRPTADLPGSETPGIQMHYGDLVHAFGRYYLVYSLSGPSTGGSLVNRVASTVDGSEWTVLTGPMRSAQWLAAGNGRLLALVFASTGTTTVSTTDGITFTSAPVPAGITNGGYMVFAGGRFFFAGSLQASLDGATWAPLAPVAFPTYPQMNTMAYGNGRYVATGYGAGTELIATLPAQAPPIVSTALSDRVAAEGTTVAWTATLDNPSINTTFQWRRNGSPLRGATNPRLEFAPVKIADAGAYSVEIRNTIGPITTEPMQLTVLPATAAGRIVNLSVLTSIDDATGPESTFTVGFVTGGVRTQGSTSLLVRAAGPALARFGVTSPISDPRLEFFSGGQNLGENDNWGGSTALADVAGRVGAFPFTTPDSKDAAVFSPNVARGDNSVKIAGNGGTTGGVLAEVYDATPAAAYTATTPRLINVSVIKSIRSGATLSAGFVIGGATPRSVLIRVVGPTLGTFGVSDALADVRAALYRAGAGTPLATNEDWGGTPVLAAAFQAVAAFALPNGSRDAALVANLEPGDYVVQAANPGASRGSALIEIYELPD